MRRAIELGPELFRFESLSEWKGLGRNPWIRDGVNIHNAVAIDARGRLCPTGAQFIRAEEEGAYPVVVYSVEPEESADEEAGANLADRLCDALRAANLTPRLRGVPIDISSGSAGLRAVAAAELVTRLATPPPEQVTYKVWRPDHGEGMAWQMHTADSPENAAKKWAKDIDDHRAYEIVSGTDVADVLVAPADGSSPAVPLRVTGDVVHQYTAQRLTEADHG